jgi:hypothetical protein
VGVWWCGGVGGWWEWWEWWVWGVWGVGVVSPCVRTFQGLHSERLWTPTILLNFWSGGLITMSICTSIYNVYLVIHFLHTND